MAMFEGSEQVICNTGFGTVTNRRVSYFSKKGWFSGGAEEDLPLRHITSVRLETSRNVIGGSLLLLVGSACFAAGAIGILIGLVFIGLAALCFWGSPKVFVNTSGTDLRPASGFPWAKPEAETFVKALRAQLFRD